MIASYCKGLCYPLPIGYNQNPLIMPGGAPIVSKVALQLQSGFMVDNSTALHTHTYIYMAACQNLVPLVNIKIAGKWMFIPLNMVLNRY